jgi:hypothetical protein
LVRVVVSNSAERHSLVREPPRAGASYVDRPTTNPFDMKLSAGVVV